MRCKKLWVEPLERRDLLAALSSGPVDGPVQAGECVQVQECGVECPCPLQEQTQTQEQTQQRDSNPDAPVQDGVATQTQEQTQQQGSTGDQDGDCNQDCTAIRRPGRPQI